MCNGHPSWDTKHKKHYKFLFIIILPNDTQWERRYRHKVREDKKETRAFDGGSTTADASYQGQYTRWSDQWQRVNGVGRCVQLIRARNEKRSRGHECVSNTTYKLHIHPSLFILSHGFVFVVVLCSNAVDTRLTAWYSRMFFFDCSPLLTIFFLFSLLSYSRTSHRPVTSTCPIDIPPSLFPSFLFDISSLLLVFSSSLSNTNTVHSLFPCIYIPSYLFAPLWLTDISYSFYIHQNSARKKTSIAA